MKGERVTSRLDSSGRRVGPHGFEGVCADAERGEEAGAVPLLRAAAGERTGGAERGGEEEREFESVATGEETKERNFELEKELLKHVMDKAKKIHGLFVYGSNKCD